MIVMKFGGTSVEDAAAMRRVSSLVRSHLDRKPVVVSSACAGVTDSLLALARGALGDDRNTSLEEVELLRARHTTIARGLFSGDILHTMQSQIDAIADELRDLVRSISILGELTDRSLDTIASFGEKLATLLLSHLFRQDGLNSVLVNALEVMITDDNYGRANPLFDEIDRRARELVRPKVEAGQVVVTQGFIGATRGGIPTTIGRGGSDYSAAIIGAALDAEEIQIWTDVDGIMTADPSVVRNARLIREMTFREAAELAYFGARVLHPSTIIPAVRKSIPVRVLNSKRPEVEGTVILRDPPRGNRGGVTSIAYKEGITLINIDSTRMLMMHGFLAKVFEVFARYGKSVDVIATSEVSLSLTVDSETNLDEILEEIRLVADVELARDKAIFCVVGESLKDTKGIIPKIFATLESHNVQVGMISLGASEINVTFVVDGMDIQKSVEALHEAFFAS